MSILIESALLKDFKTFRGENKITFVQPFTCIHGPNGTGKSNLLDAIIFALGAEKQSLRIHSFEDLVYKPPKKTTDLPKSCSVQLSLKTIENNIILLRRSYNKDIGTISYYINEKDVSIVNYKNKLESLNFDISLKYCAILQGDIEQIVLQTPRERTTFLEEVCGSDALRREYTRLQNNFEKACSEFKLIQEKKKQLNKVKKSTQKIKHDRQEYSIWENRYKKASVQLVLCHIYDIENKVKRGKNEYKNLHEKLQEFIHENTRTVENRNVELAVKKAQLSKLETELENVEKSINNLENDCNIKNKIIKIEEATANATRKVGNIQLSLIQTESVYNKCQQSIQDLETQLKDVNEITVLYESPILEERSPSFDEELVAEYHALQRKTERECDIHFSKINELMLQQVKVKCNFNNLKRKINEKIKKLSNDAALLQKISNENVNCKQTDENLKDHIKNLVQEIKDAKTHATNMLQRLQVLKEVLDDVKYNKYEKEKMHEMKDMDYKLKMKFGTKVYGRLNSLCKPSDEKYKIALTKILFSHANALVVDSEKTAKECIKYLQSKKIGRATFLPLDTLQDPFLKNSLRNLNNAYLAYECLVFTEDVSKAIFFGVQNTVICEDEEQASYLSKTLQTNCVSLAGSLFKRSGIFSGGLVDLKKKAEQWKSNDRNYEMLKISKSKLKAEISKNDEDIRNKQSTLADLKTELEIVQSSKTCAHLLQNKENDLIKSIDEAENDLRTLNLEMKETETEMKEMEEKQAKEEDEIAKKKKEIFSNFCQKLNIENITEYEKHSLTNYKEKIRRKIDLINQSQRISEMLKADKERKKQLKNDVEKWKANVENLEKNVVTLKQELSKLKENYKIDCDKLAKLKTQRETLQISIQKTKHEISNLKKRIQSGDIESSYHKQQFMLKEEILKLRIKRKEIIYDALVNDLQLPFLEGNYNDLEQDTVSALSSNEEICVNDFIIKFDFKPLLKNFENIDDTSKYNDVVNILNKKVEEAHTEMEKLKQIIQANDLVENVDEKLEKCKKKYKNVQEIMKSAKMSYETIKQKRYNKFMELLDYLNDNMSRIYKKLNNDENAIATLLPEDPENPFLSGLKFMCQCTGKPLMPINDFSGGEKTLTGLTLICTIQSWKPCVLLLDEIDAPLSPESIAKVCKFFHEFKNTSQIISVSLNPSFCNAVDSIIGSVNTEGFTTVVAIDLTKYSN